MSPHHAVALPRSPVRGSGHTASEYSTRVVGRANAAGLALMCQGRGDGTAIFAGSKVKLAGKNVKHLIRLDEFKAHV